MRKAIWPGQGRNQIQKNANINLAKDELLLSDKNIITIILDNAADVYLKEALLCPAGPVGPITAKPVGPIGPSFFETMSSYNWTLCTNIWKICSSLIVFINFVKVISAKNEQERPIIK